MCRIGCCRIQLFSSFRSVAGISRRARAGNRRTIRGGAPMNPGWASSTRASHAWLAFFQSPGSVRRHVNAGTIPADRCHSETDKIRLRKPVKKPLPDTVFRPAIHAPYQTYANSHRISAEGIDGPGTIQFSPCS